MEALVGPNAILFSSCRCSDNDSPVYKNEAAEKGDLRVTHQSKVSLATLFCRAVPLSALSFFPRKCSNSLQPYKQRPETCAALAKRLVSGKSYNNPSK